MVKIRVRFSHSPDPEFDMTSPETDRMLCLLAEVMMDTDPDAAFDGRKDEITALYGTLVRRSRSATSYHLTRRGQAQLLEQSEKDR